MKVTINEEENPEAFVRTDNVYHRGKIEAFVSRGVISGHVLRLLKELPEDSFIGGSFLESAFRQATEKDIDVFFKTEESFYGVINRYSNPDDFVDYESESIFSGYESIDKEVLLNLVNSDAPAITIKSNSGGPSIQFVKSRLYESAEALIDSFDFTVCQFAIDKNTMEVVFNPMGILDMTRNRLVPHKITFPASSLRRLIKYTHKGYFACGGSLVTLVQMLKSSKDNDEVLYID